MGTEKRNPLALAVGITVVAVLVLAQVGFVRQSLSGGFSTRTPQEQAARAKAQRARQAAEKQKLINEVRKAFTSTCSGNVCELQIPTDNEAWWTKRWPAIVERLRPQMISQQCLSGQVKDQEAISDYSGKPPPSASPAHSASARSHEP